MEALVPSSFKLNPTSPLCPSSLSLSRVSIFAFPSDCHASSSSPALHHVSRHGSRFACFASRGASGDRQGHAGEEDGNDDPDDLDRALRLDGEIPESSNAFLNQVSSRAYTLRSQLEYTSDSTTYDLLEANPWREDSKPVYVLAQKENKILTMRTRRSRSEVERELDLLFPKRGSRRGKNGLPKTSFDRSSQTLSPSSNTHFRMVVEDVREGVLVFEDEEEATRYCSVLEGHGQSCMGVAELDASDVFALCQKIKALAVLFRRGRVPPLPDRLQQNLKARKISLEDQS